MMLMGEAIGHRRLRAPRENGGRLIDPPLDSVGAIIARNAALVADSDYDVQGRPLAQLAATGRAELVAAAFRYTAAYRDVPAPRKDQATRVLVAGHQPQLFHPGVWFKNFALSAMAAAHQAVAVNLIIDSDTIKSAALRVPTGTVESPRAESLALDRSGPEIPFEERSILDRSSLASFGQRAAETLAPLVPNPLVGEFWPLVVERAGAVENLGECLAQARHVQEGRWGAATLEIPQSQVCGLDAFRWFACHLLARLPRLWEAYNRSVADYRRANHVRSSAHPVPDLAAEGEWLEAPFWIWDRENPRRRRLFVRQRGDEIVLADRGALEYALPLTPEGEADRAVQRWQEMAGGGVRIRTRALITTLFARLLLGDLFVHGIGGAKYDQVTDLLMQRFFGLAPPGYLTATATLRLPIRQETVTVDDARRIDHQLRELAYHPEQFLDASDRAADQIVEEKRKWIAVVPTRENARQRCRAIHEANDRLQPWVTDRWKQLLEQRDHVADVLRAQAVLNSREYAFCLYPAESLQALMDLPR